MPKKCKWTL